MGWPVVEDAPDVGRQRHEAQKMLRKELLAFVDVCRRVTPTSREKRDVATFELRETQPLKYLSDWKEVIHS